MIWKEFVKKCRTGYPASIPAIVAHIQKYLTDNPIQSEEVIDEKIETEIESATGTITDSVIDYLEEHPEIIPTTPVDSALSTTSENAVQNKVITTALNDIPIITVDSALSTTSENPVQNKVIKTALDNIPSVIVDNALSATSTNPVQNKVIKAALDNIPVITVDGALSTTSENPVQNKIITAAINNIPIPPTISVDSALSTTSTNPVQNKVITQALNSVTIPVDSQLSTTSENPVQNKVITNALSNRLTATEVVFNVASWSNGVYWPSGNGTHPLGETDNVCSRAEVTQDADGNAIACADGDGFVVEEWSQSELPAPVWVYVDNNKIWVATRNLKTPSSQITIKGLILHRG